MTDIQLQETWEEILKNLENSLSTRVCNNWLKPLKPIKLTTEMLELGAPNVFTKNWVEKYYLPFLTDSCYEITKAHLEISITNLESTKNAETIYPDELKQQQLKKRNTRVRTKKKATSLAQSNDLFQPTLTEAMQPPSEMTETPLPINPGDKSSLNPKYTFESFVIGNSNSFAHAAALAIAENPAKDYNPFFMYGGVGLGKTHLMHAIGHKILQKHPQKRVLYTTSEKFTNELINSIKDGTSAAFRQKYRNIDVLLVDDVQFLANKERIQEEFFHTFNALKDANKQIILSSDRPPKEIKPLEDRLCSRFEGGLLADVQAPDLETRIAILKKKTLMDNLDVPLDVMTYIASHIDNNVRELEGALTRVVAYASFKHYPVTNELAVDVLKNTITKQEPTVKQADKIINIALIQETVAKYFKLTLADLNGKKRNRNIAFPRQIAMFLAREMTDASLPRIGGNFGGRDHTTVMHAHDKIKKQYQDNPKTASVIDEIRKLITS